MGILQWFRSPDRHPSPDDLRSAVLDAFAREDGQSAMHLINANADRIRTDFKSWLVPPAHIRSDPAAMEKYVGVLMAVATLFERSGDSSLMRQLQGEGRDNPIARWHDAMERAEKLTNDHHPEEAIKLLRDALDSMNGLTGTAVDQLRPKLLGRLGIALSQQGDTHEAIRVTRDALDLCRSAGDEEGVRTYLANLEFLGTYDIDVPGVKHTLRAVFIDSNGRTLTREELSSVEGKVRWEIRGGEPADPEVRRLHEEGRAAGQAGNHTAAIALFTQAAERDPAWPYPLYDRAFTHLLEQRFDAALDDYRRTLELSPAGFFIARTAADMLKREAAGEFPSGLYAAFAMLEHMPSEQQQSIAAQLVEQFPSHAPAWELHARLASDPAAKLDAVEQGLEARPDPDVRGALLLQRAIALNMRGERSKALDLLDTLAASPGDSLATHANATLLAGLLRRPDADSADRLE